MSAKTDLSRLFLPADGIYLLSHSVGRQPASTSDVVQKGFFNVWARDGADIWSNWLQQIDAFRDGLAALLNDSSENFCPQTNLSSGLTKLIYSVQPPKDRRVLLFSELDFPSMGFVLNQAKRSGYELREIPASADLLDPATWDRYLSEDVYCAFVTHVDSNTGRCSNMSEICSMARDRDVRTIVDIAQSVGVVPIDLRDWRADFVLGSCVKWLCGGPGAGFLWVNPDRLEDCKPIDVGWFSHADPFEFDIHSFRYADNALRFWGGTPSVLPFVVAADSIDLINRIGVQTIRKHNIELTTALLASVDERFVVSPIKPGLRGGTVVLNFQENHAAIEKRLTETDVQFDTRSHGLRLSPHIYTTNEEIEIAASCF